MEANWKPEEGPEVKLGTFPQEQNGKSGIDSAVGEGRASGQGLLRGESGARRKQERGVGLRRVFRLKLSQVPYPLSIPGAPRDMTGQQA